MAHPENELISNIIDRGDWRAVQDCGLLPTHFLTDDGIDVFTWLFDEYVDSREVPGKNRVRRKFPNFEFCSTRDPIKTLVREVKRSHVRSVAYEIIAEMNELLEDDEDPMEVLALNLPALRDLTVEFTDNDGVLMGSSADELAAEYDETRNAGGVLGLPFPWDPLNLQTGGMQDGQFIVLYARPKNMKTWLLCATAVHIYLEVGKRVAVYSKEMTIKQMRRRCASIIAQLDDGKIRTGRLSDEDEDIYKDCLYDIKEAEQDAVDAGRRSPALLFLSDKGVKGGSTVESLRARIEKFEPDILFVDGFYLMRDARSGKKNRDWTTVSNISADIKELALEMDIPVFGTTQANREAAKGSGDDLAEVAYADAIAQDADLVMRCIKGKAPEGYPEVMLTFPGARDAEIRPFTLNARPGQDFSTRSTAVDVKQFIERAKQAYLNEQGVDKEEKKAKNKRTTPRRQASRNRIRK